LLYLFLTVGLVLVSFPFVWMVLTSFKSYTETTQLPPSVFPSVWNFENYAIAWRSAPFGRYLFNSTVVAGSVVLGVLISSILAAYAFAYMNFFGRNLLFLLFLSTMMIPFETILIPNFIIIRQLGWYNTYAALIIPWTGNVFSVFLIRQFFLSLPKDLVDAAVIDGCGHQRFLWWVAVPLSRPAVTVVALFNFLWSWNGLLWPLIVTSSEQLRPVQLGLSVFLTEDGASYQLLMAAATFTMLPIVVLYLAAQRQFIEGIAAGGVKG
jgi:multiple sugar transport system permease protein